MSRSAARSLHLLALTHQDGDAQIAGEDYWKVSEEIIGDEGIIDFLPLKLEQEDGAILFASYNGGDAQDQKDELGKLYDGLVESSRDSSCR